MSIIAISRGTFSGGEAVAVGVAAALGYRCVSREVILETARGHGVPPEEVAAAMEKRPPLWDRMLGRPTSHLTLMRAALSDCARGGRLVYHGHLGHLLLPGVQPMLRIRVIADMEYRIPAAMQQHGSRQEAVAYIEKMDRERRQWTRFLFDVDWNDASLYDLVINLSVMSVKSACAIIAGLAATPEFQLTPASLQALEDVALASRVEAALATDARTSRASLEVVARAGSVTVSGTTQSPAVLNAIPEVAGRVAGLKEFKSLVRLLREGRPNPAT